MKPKGISLRRWLFLILAGLVGQLAWSLENRYLNTFITYINFSAPVRERFDYSLYIALTTAFSAIVATLTTIFMGTLTDKVGHRREFISFGYLLWGIATAGFGLFNVNSSAELIPLTRGASRAAVWVIILDCTMTFFGSTANDAAFNSYVTKNIGQKDKGKAEGVLSVLPLISRLILFVGFNGLTTDSKAGVHDARWDLFFYLIGGIVFLSGIVSFFLIPKEQENRKSSDEHYLSLLLEGFKPKTVKENKSLYLILLIYFVFGTANNVFFPYLRVYLEHTCGISNTAESGILTPFAIVRAVALLLGSLLTIVLGFLSDKVGKEKRILPVFALYGISLVRRALIPNVGEVKSRGRTVYACFAGLLMIFGFVGIPTIINALVREKIPEGKEGVFRGVRRLFVVALPMCIGPFIGDAFNSRYGGKFPDPAFPEVRNETPSSYGYYRGLGILALSLIPIYFYFREERKHGMPEKQRDK